MSKSQRVLVVLGVVLAVGSLLVVNASRTVKVEDGRGRAELESASLVDASWGRRIKRRGSAPGGDVRFVALAFPESPKLGFDDFNLRYLDEEDVPRLEEAVRKVPESFLGKFILANLYWRLGRMEDSERLRREALDAAPLVLEIPVRLDSERLLTAERLLRIHQFPYRERLHREGPFVFDKWSARVAEVQHDAFLKRRRVCMVFPRWMRARRCRRTPPVSWRLGPLGR